MKHAHYNQENNEIVGWYSRDVHSTIPEPSIEVEDSVWQQALENGWNHIDANGVLSRVDFSTPDEKAKAIRLDRDVKLRELDLIVSNPLRWNEFTEKQKSNYIAYRQKLLDVPQQSGFPDNVVWPTIGE